MHSYTYGKLPDVFDDMFTSVNSKYHYCTRLASKSSNYKPKIRTNYGKFGIRFQGPKVWNVIDECIKLLNKYSFKRKLKEYFIKLYDITK